MIDGPFKPPPQDAILAINSPRYADLRAEAEGPEFRGILFELESVTEPPPFLHAMVDRLTRNIDPEGPQPINLRRDVRDIVGFLDRSLPVLPQLDPKADHTLRIGSQIALKKELGTDDTAFLIELWPALDNPSPNPVLPTDIIDQSKVTKIRYDRFIYEDGVGFIQIISADVVVGVVETKLNDKLTLSTESRIPLIRSPYSRHERERRLSIKKELGHDIWDPKFKKTT